VKVHTEKSFFVCVAAGVVGFLLVMAGLAVGFIDRNAATIAYLSAGAGIITEIISGIFFYLYNRTVRQMKTYHDSLLAVQNILLSFKLLDDTEGGPDKAAMVTQMVTYLVGKHEGVSVLHAPGVDRVS